MKRLLILLLLFLIRSASALDPHKPISEFVHNVWRSEDGLPQNSIQAVLQTHDGYLWLGTQEGLVRFNGVEFKVFNKSNTDAMQHNDIRVLYEDRAGSLWVGTFGGGLVRYHNGQFTAYTAQNGLCNDSITAILEDHKGNLWVGTTDGLNELTGGRFLSFNRKNGLSDNSVGALAEDAEGRILVATRGGLDAVQEGRPVGPLRTLSPTNVITALLLDQQKNLWIGTDSHGLNVVSAGKVRHYGAAQGLPNAPVHAIFEDNQQTIWIGTQGGGLCRLQAGHFSCYSTPNGLSGDYVESIVQDREGSLWVGTETGGLNRFKEGVLSNYGSELGLQGSPRALFEDHAGSVWIGTNRGLWRLKDGKAIPYFTTKGAANNYVYALFQDREGNIWAGTDQGGLNRFTGHTVKTFTKADGLTDDFVQAVYQDRAGDIWAGTFAGGLSRLHHGKFINYTTKEGLGSNRVWAIEADHLGNLWIGTDAGISLFHDGSFVNFDLRDASLKAASMGAVMVIHEDSDHAFWIGTYGAGLKRFKDGQFTTIGLKQGLFDETIWSILEDDSGNFWMSSNRGIFKVAKKELIEVMEGRLSRVQSQSYGVADGMISSECNGGSQYSGWKTRQGKLLFACLKSVVVVDPNHLPLNPLPPPVVIETVRINQQEKIAPGARVPVGMGELEFHYSALSYFAPEKVVFKCRLEGYEEVWNTPVTPGFFRYTNIPPGKYTFQVIAANNDGVWNDAGAGFSFYLAPRFYQAKWFYFICGLLLVLAPIAAYLLRIRQIRVRERELLVLVSRRTRELQMAKEIAEAATRAKGDFLANMSHEIRTPLNGVTGMLDLIGQSELTTDQKQLLGMARDSAGSLMAVINDILDFSRLEAGKLALDAREFDLPEAVAESMRIVALCAHQKGLELVYQIDPSIPRVLVADIDRIRQVLHNLVGNAVKFTEHGEIFLRVTPAERAGQDICLRFEITDTGIGIPVEKQQLIFEAFAQADASVTRKFGGTGLGLAISSRIVELLGGTIGVESKAGEGSTFFFTARTRVPSPAQVTTATPSEIALCGASALIVDDNQHTLAVLEQMLRGWGMKVSTAGSVESARNEFDTLLRSGVSPLLLIDSRLPGQDGFTLAAQVASLAPRTAIVMMLTSDDYLVSVGKCRELRISLHLIKPVKQSELLAAIRQSLLPERKLSGAVSPGEAGSSARLRVLVADDNSVNQKLALRLLQKMGHEAVIANNGREVLRLLAQETFDLVLMDVQMPEMDGLAATREIRKRESGRRKLPVIAMTAHAMRGDRESCLEAGMDGYIAKPINPAELRQAIEHAMKARNGFAVEQSAAHD